MTHHRGYAPDGTGPPAPQVAEPPRWGGVRLGPTLVGGLYGLLVGASGLSFFGRQFPGRLPRVLENVTPWIFLTFLICFAFYRLGLVRAGKYTAFKAFFQIGLGLVVFLMLLPGQAFHNPSSSEGLEQLLEDPNPRVRMLAAEVARYRQGGVRYAPLLARVLEDEDPSVRREAHLSLVQLSGTDLGGPEDPAAVRGWKARFP